MGVLPPFEWGQGKTAFASLKSPGRCKSWFDSRPGGQPRKGNIKQKGSEFSPSLLPFTWFGNTLSCMLFRATRRAGKAGYEPATWPEDLGPYTVPYLKRQRSRLISGHILVRGQGEPPEYRIRNGREHGQRHDTEDPGPSETGWARGAHFRAQRDGEGCADQAQGRTGGQAYRRIETSLGMAGEKDRTGSTCWNFRQVGPVFAFGGEERRHGEG